ncbi:hypothetical protein CC86DRAFT_406356 [Ophiobolus disseminans]|uniref:Uncharacterized protein n=1 Tax=Ophiobolus disseminans TaxID=1469910 RepID=A0A6A7A3K0_9PLEO|nr:hypothetical protein CC86DRAFT_406356 [Ophiobolus disseminans]
MAGSDSNSSRAEQLREKIEKTSIAINISIKIPRRKVTLITITLLLNVLHWSSIICLTTSIYQIASNPDDSISVPSEVLTLTSGVATLSYTYLHTIISLKQKIWSHQRGHASAIKRTSYVAIRFAVSLCVLWLLTSGWNMIIVARRPVCLADAPGLQVWEVGLTCRVGRLGMAFAVISLLASCTLFGTLAVVRRPFEAHLFKHGYEPPNDPFATPATSRNPSPERDDPHATEKQMRGRRPSMSTRRNDSVSDVDTIDLSNSPPPPTIHAPSPQRSMGLGIFTSDLAPPPIPPEFVALPRVASLENLPPLFQPSISPHSLTLPPRLSGQVPTSGFIPFSIAPQFSASTWRALHPNSPTSMGIASRSNPNLPSVGFAYHNRYSRSSISLTKPHRLSTATPSASVAWSSRSGSTGPEGREASTTSEDNKDRRASANDIAFAILNGTPIPGTTRPQTRGKYHVRTASAPDTTAGAQQPLPLDRMAMGWKPQLAGSSTRQDDDLEPETESVPLKLARIVRSSSAELLSRFSPDSSPDNDDRTPQRELERNIDARVRVMKELPFRRSRSADHVGRADTFSGASEEAMSRKFVSKDTKARVLHSEPEWKRRMTFDEVKNKPLPKIAIL